MIKRITLKNFESHEDSTIEFVDGLNLIIGPSNQGKSSIVRAISMVVANRFDKDSVRTGTNFCSVKIETEKGSVTAERGEETNHWIIETPDGKKKEYKNIGIVTPPEVLEILGMGERIRGEMKELPNIMFQLEKHYMLSEIDGKKATSNVIARMMDEAIGIGGMEELIKDIATDFTSKKKELTEKSNKISELKSEILEESIFKDYESSVEQTKKNLEEVEELNDLLENSKLISDKIAENNSSRLKISADISVSDGFEELSDSVKRDIEQFVDLNESVSISRRITQINELLDASKSIEEDSNNIESQKSKLNLLEKACLLQNQIRNISNQINSNIDFSILQDAENLQISISEAEKMLFTARDLYKKIRNLSNRVINIEKEQSKKESELNSLKSKLGTCPLCGGKL